MCSTTQSGGDCGSPVGRAREPGQNDDQTPSVRARQPGPCELLAELRAELHELKARHYELKVEHDELKGKHDELKAEHDELKAEHDETKVRLGRAEAAVFTELADARLYPDAERMMCPATTTWLA